MCSFNIYLIDNLLGSRYLYNKLGSQMWIASFKFALLPENGIAIEKGSWHLKHLQDTNEY